MYFCAKETQVMSASAQIDVNKLIKRAFLIRFAEEKLLSLFKEGRINGTVHTCLGQELIPVCLAEHLDENDLTLSNHRGHGHLFNGAALCLVVAA